MKELSIEEKAKAYDEALERAKGVIEQNPLMEYLKKGIEYILPELKESEDAMIIRELTSLFKDGIKGINHTYTGEDCERWVAWLEKQSTPQVRTGLEWVNTIDDACDKRYSEEYAHGEYCHEQSFKWGFQEGVDWLEKQGENHIVGNNEMVKPIDKVEQKSAVLVPKFHVGDKLVSTYNTSLTYEVLEVGHINKLGNPDYKVEIFTDGKAENPRNIHYMECYKVDEWAKLIEQKHAWSEEDESYLNTTIAYLKDAKEFKKTAENCINWLKSLKDRVQPKQEWSEEDEEMFYKVTAVINKLCAEGKEYVWSINTLNKLFYWIKSLKERIQPQPKQKWKPTKEQLETFDYYLDADISNKDKEILFGLYNDLKKL